MDSTTWLSLSAQESRPPSWSRFSSGRGRFRGWCLTAADDYILSPGDVQALRGLQAHPGELEVTRVMDNGGHVGLDWNPKVAEAAIDFAMAAPQLKG